MPARICPVADADLYQTVGKLEGRIFRLEGLDAELRSLRSDITNIPKKLNGSQRKTVVRDAGMGTVGGALVVLISFALKLLETA
tara:strand:+ start:1689 stop:1940 length:252 start_codon:yes stop_codon:yes gene_type:complete